MASTSSRVKDQISASDLAAAYCVIVLITRHAKHKAIHWLDGLDAMQEVASGSSLRIHMTAPDRDFDRTFHCGNFDFTHTPKDCFRNRR
jgi:hypothetical protein